MRAVGSTGAFFSPGHRRRSSSSRACSRLSTSRKSPRASSSIVNETDDGFATFERVAGGLGSTGTVAVGDRVWGETVLNLGRILGFDRLRTGSTLVNEPSPREDARGAGGDGTRDSDRGADDGGRQRRSSFPARRWRKLAEAVEHELRAAGSRTPPSRRTSSRARRGRARLAHRDGARADAGRHVSDVRLRRCRRRVLLGLRAHDLLRRSSGRLPRGLRDHACRAGGRTRGRRRRHDGIGGERGMPRADRGGRARRALPPPHGPWDRHGRPRAAVHLRRRTRRRSSPG